MTIRIESEIIHVEGNSPVEDAEPILAALQDGPARSVDVSRAVRLHSASIQILLALRPPIIGLPSDSFQAHHLSELLDLSS